MATKDIKFSIGENDYYIRQWPARKAITMKLRIMKILGGTVAELAKAVNSTSELAKEEKEVEQLAALSKAFEKLFENANEEQLVDLLVEVVEQATRNGERMYNRFDEVFSDDLTESYKVFIKIIVGNYSDFLKGLKQKGGLQLNLPE